MKIVERVELEWAVLEFMDIGILRVRYKEGVMIDEVVARAVVAALTSLSGGLAPLPGLVCLDRVKGLTREARQFFAVSDELSAASTAIALLVSSPVSRVIANFFLGMNRPRVPTRSFTSEDAAIAWLLQHGPSARP